MGHRAKAVVERRQRERLLASSAFDWVAAAPLGLILAPSHRDDAALRALSAWGLDAGTVYIAAYRQQDVEGFFTESDGGARPVPVQAGRMIQVAVPDLGP